MLHLHYTHTAPTLTSGGIKLPIRATGNLYHILAFLLFPLVWTLPKAAVTAETGAAFRDPSAGMAWVEECFGET